MVVKVPEGQRVNLQIKPGDTLEWTLVEKGGSGYMWNFHAEPAGSVEIKTKRDMSKFTGIGAPVHLIATIKFLRPVSVTLTAAHIRPFIGLNSSIDTRVVVCAMSR